MGFDVQEYRKNRANQEKEVTKQGGGFDVQTYRRQKQAPQVGEDITNRVNTWLKDNEFFINTYNQRNASPSSYRADTADWLSKATSRTKALGSEANDIRAILADYADFYDPKWVNSINSVLDSSTSLYDKILSASTKDHEYWSQWADEDSYKKAMAGWLNENAEVDEESIEQRRARYQSNADRIAELEKKYKTTGIGFVDDTINAIRNTDWTSGHVSNAYEDDLRLLDELKAENLRYEREQKRLDDYYVPETEEFLQNAAFRDYANPTMQDFQAYAMASGDTAALIGAGYDLTKAGWRDKDGNLIELNFDAQEPIIQDKLGFYRDNFKNFKGEESLDVESANSDYANNRMAVAMLEGKKGSWEFLTEKEVNIYYDLLKREGQESAYEFLDAMQTILNKRATQAMAQQVADAGVGAQIAYNVASIPANVLGGAGSFVDDAIHMIKGEDINPYSYAHRWQNFAQAVRQDTAQDINKATGNVALPYVGTTFGDVYQAIMSGVDSAVGIGLGGTTYGILMGMGAASSEAKELYEKGASTGQIAAGGLLAGAAEMVFEKYSIDKFVKMGDAKTLKALAVNALKQGGVEASEEVLTEIANTLSDAVVMGSQSDWQGYIDKYIAEGYSESEATVKALFNDVAPNVINAGIGGLISGGAMGSIGSTGSYFNYQNRLKSHGQSIIDRGGVDTVKALADDMAGVKAVSKASSKVGSKASAKNVGRLSVAIEEAMSAQNKADIESALVEKGLSKSEAKRVAALLTGNEALTKEQQAELEGNEKVAEVVKELVNNSKSTLNQRKLNLLVARLGIDTKNANINAKSTSVDGISLKNEVDVKDKVSEEGKTVKISTGEAITIDKRNAIARTKIVDGERKVYYNTDHGVVEDTDINYANEDDGLLYEAFSDMNPAFANAVIKNYDGSVPVQKYIDGMREGIILYGMHNFQEVGKDISVNSNLAELSKADQAFALKLGRAYAEDNAKKADTSLRTAIKNEGSVRFENGTRAKTVAQKRAVSLAKHLSKAIGIDIVFYDAMTTRDKNGKKANGYFDSKTNSIHLDLQNAVTDSKTIAFTLSHELVHFIKKWSPAKFNTFSKFLMEQYAAHGVSTSTLLANKMAALGKTDADYAYEEMICDACERMLLDSNAVVKLMELRKSDLELFEKIKLHVLEILNKIRDAFKGVDPNTEEGIALQKMEDVLGKIHEMFEDAVVDAAQNYQAGQTLDTEAVSVSEDGTIQMQMKQYQQTGRSTLLNYLTSQYGENNANDLISTIDSIYNVMAEIKEDTALSVFGNWQDTEVELNAEGHPIFTTSINNGDYVLNQDFSRVCKKRRQLDFVLNMLAEDQAFEASHLTNEDFVKINNAIKSHGFEIACALCFVDSKRFRQAEWADSFANTWNDILGSIVKDDSKLTPFNFATNNPNMSDDGIEIDSSKSVTYRKWSEGKEDVKNRRTYENFEQMFAKGKNGKWLEGNTNVRTIATLLRDHPELRHTFRGADIIASKGFDTIQRLAPEVRSILDGWGGSSVPKPSSNDASYDSSIINSKGYNKENAYAMGGVRMNSFSDFMAHMFFDYCQAFADLSAKELPSQAYTKELTYVRLFGRSGQKINMSGIAAIRDDALPTVAGKGVTKAQAEANEKIEKMVAGLDITRLLEHLNKDIYQLTETDVEQFLDMCDYVWADESINMKHATLLQTGILYDKLSETKIEECYELLKAGKVDQALKAAGEENVDREYAKHCGTIVVGVSDAHIRKLLRDPNVRMVIPYHKSGLNPIIARELKISAYNDYTDVQNTGVIRKGTKSRSNLTNEEIKKAYGLKDFAFYDWFGKTIDGKLYDGKATADKYLEWCEKGYYDENVGDYVYYTSKGDGYILASELHKKLTVEPKFKDFTGEENYYKLLEDFDCYNTITGEHSEQGAVDFLRDGLPTDYKGVLIEALKAEQKVSDDFKEHLDNKGLRDEIINIVKAHGYTPSESAKDDGIKKQVKRATDKDYLDAVNRGDMETAQRMVDEAAMAAGYDTKAYHGTKAFGFTKIDVSQSDDGLSFFATDSVEIAGTYSADKRVKRIADAEEYVSDEDIEKLEEEGYDAMVDIAEWANRQLGVMGWADEEYLHKQLEKVFIDAQNQAITSENITEKIFEIFDDLFYEFSQRYYEDNYENNPYLGDEDYIDWDEWEGSQEYDELSEKFYPYVDKIHNVATALLSANGGLGIYSLYINTSNNLIVDCKGEMWNKISADNLPDIKSSEYQKYGYRSNRDHWTTRSVAKYANDNGYDGVTFKNIIDTNDGGKDVGTVYIAFKPQEQIKSADPVTYDDEGNVIPLSERFNAKNDDIRYQKKTSTNRTLLANALESAAQNDIERNKLAQYKSKIDLIESEQAKLAEVRATKGRTPDETKALDFEANQIANRINTYDRQLLNLESTTALKNVLQREKAQAYKRAEQKGKEALAKYKKTAAETQRELMNRYQESRKKGVEGRKKTDVKNKIRRVVRNLNHLLNHGTKERNVKEGEKDVVASAISVAELLFSDDISNADIVRLGVDNPSALANEKALLKEYKSLLDSIKATDDQIAGLQTLDNPTQERYKLMDDLEAVKKKYENKISTLDKKLSDFFARERARLNEGKVADVIGKLVNEYSALENSGDDYIKNAYSENVKKRLEALQKGLDGTLVRDMTLIQLVEVYDAYKMIEHMVRTSNNLFREGRTEDLMEIVSAVQSEIYKLYKDKGDPIASIEAKKNIINTFGWNNLKPVFAFDRLGSDTFKELYWDAVRADDDFAKLVEEAGNFISEQREKYGFADWDLTSATEFTLADGKVFKLTLEDMMSIYAYSKRDQADAHMTEGGFVFDENNTYTEKPFDGKKILENFRLTRKHARLTETYRVDDRVLAQIVGFFNKRENADKKSYVDAMQKYMTDMGQKGNEVSRTLYGIDLFTDENYIPLQVQKDYLNSNKQALEKTPTQVSLKNNGTTKPTTPNADNPIVLRAFDELWLEHIDTMSKYCAYVLPIENLTRVFNNVSRIEGESPMATKSLISAVFGNGAKAYFDQYITDLNGGNSVGGYNSPLITMFSRFKGTAVGASLSVIVQQPLSIIRAMDMIRPDYFAPFFRGKAAKTTDADSTWEEIKKHAPIAILKEMGGYDIGSANSTKDYIGVTEYKGAKDKAKGFVNDPKYRKKAFGDAVMYGATKADEIGWGIIWKAVKKEVATEQNLTPGTEEFFKAVRDRFTEVVVRTQVYDSVNSRSGIMRSKNDLNKFATSFMGEPTTVINMFYNAGLQATRAIKSKDKALIKQNIGHLARTSGVLLATTVFTVLAKSAIYANRDDDDDESWTERWMKNTGDSLVSDLNPLSMIPYARDLVSIYEGWDIERPDMTLFAKVITSAKRAIEDGATKEEILALAGDIANMFGIPAKNVVRDVRGIINLISDHFDNITTVDAWGAFGRGWTGEEQTKSDALYTALINDDKGRLKHYKSGYKTDSDYQSAIRKALRENDSRIKDAAQAKVDRNISEYTRIVQEIIAEVNFVKDIQDIVVGAVYAEIDAIKNGESQEEETPKDEVTSIYRGSDVNDAFEYGDNALAKSIIKELIDTKVANGMEEKNAKSSVRSSMTSYWKPLYKAAYKAGNAEETRRIRMILNESGIYGGIDDIIDTCKAWLRDN